MTMTQNFVDSYVIDQRIGGFVVLRNGFELRDADGWARIFRTRNSARKRISRERRGNYHA